MRKVIRKISAAIVATTITVTGNGASGNGFKSIRIGIRAQVQHLKATLDREKIGTKELTVVCQAQQQVLSQLIWMRLAGAVCGEHRHTETSQ